MNATFRLSDILKYPATPLGLVSDDDPLPEDPFKKTDDDLGFLQVTLGSHVPYLDVYKRGDPGGFNLWAGQAHALAEERPAAEILSRFTGSRATIGG